MASTSAGMFCIFRAPIWAASCLRISTIWALRGTSLGRKAWLFAGSDRGGDRTAFIYSLTVTAKMNDIDPQAWLADVLARMPALTVLRLPELLPWHWQDASSKQKPPDHGLRRMVTIKTREASFCFLATAELACDRKPYFVEPRGA